jgi:transcriptional regulator GlxA family with amidase domain
MPHRIAVLALDQVVGFGTTASLRQHLRTAIGVAPGTYRRSFRPAAA